MVLTLRVFTKVSWLDCGRRERKVCVVALGFQVRSDCREEVVLLME